MNGAYWLFVDSAAAFGGHEVMLLRWLEELQQQARITPVLLARAHTRLYEQASSSVTTLPLPAAATGKIVRAISDAWRTIKLVLQLKPQLCIVAEGCLLSQASFTLLLRLMNLRTVVYVPLVEPAKNMGYGRGAQRDWLMRHVYRHLPHAWITITPEQARHLAAWSGIATPIFALPNTVTKTIENAVIATQPARQPLRVLVLGRLDAHQKGLDGLLDALLDTLVSQPKLSEELHIDLVGDGSYATEIERRLQQYPELQRLLSMKPWTPTLEALQQHDVLLLTSRYEGVPLVMLEAMALRMPVIASDLPGTRAMLPAECLFAVGDYQRALQLLHLAMGAAWRDDIAQRNRTLFMARASGKAFAQAVDGLTDQLLQLGTSPVAAPFSTLEGQSHVQSTDI